MPNGVNGIEEAFRLSNSNGVKDINVEEGDRKIHITVNADKSIKMEITEKKDGKDDNEKIRGQKSRRTEKEIAQSLRNLQGIRRRRKAAMGGVLQLNTANAPCFSGMIRLGDAGARMAVPVPGGMPLGAAVPLHPGWGRSIGPG